MGDKILTYIRNEIVSNQRTFDVCALPFTTAAPLQPNSLSTTLEKLNPSIPKTNGGTSPLTSP